MIHYIHDIMYIMIQTTDMIYYYITIFYLYIYIYVLSVRGEYHMYQLIPLHTCDYLQRTSIKINVATDEGKQPK